MANYADPDKFFDESQIEFGIGVGKESIRANLKSTNGAAYRAEQNSGAAANGIKALSDFITQSFKYQNQPEGGEGTDNIISSVNATNGQVYRTAAEVTALRKEVAEVKLLLQQFILASAGKLKEASK